MQQPRPYNRWALLPPQDPARPSAIWGESASIPLLLESMRRHAEIAEVGRERFSGNLAGKNKLWLQYRNFLRQALSNFEAATTVGNRFASLLYYYAMLNFAKAELLDTNSAQIANVRIGHGLSFSPASAQTVAGDTLTVTNGLFPLLYKRRTGRTLPHGLKLPIKRLLANVPEIAQHLGDARLGRCQISGLYQLLAMDATGSWTVLAIPSNGVHDNGISTSKLFRHFREISQPQHWRDHFGLSRRVLTPVRFLESITTVPLHNGCDLDTSNTLGLTWLIKDLIGLRTDENFDAWFVPFLYRSKQVVMPPSLARYAITYYASSLVRYKPSVFDVQLYPEQACLFDAIARECALPMLIDTFSALEGRDQLFYAAASFRL